MFTDRDRYSEEYKQMGELLDKVYARGFDRCMESWRHANKRREEEAEDEYANGVKRGMEIAWNVARMLRHPSYNGSLTEAEKIEIFGTPSSDGVLTKFTAQEAVEALGKHCDCDGENITHESGIGG